MCSCSVLYQGNVLDYCVDAGFIQQEDYNSLDIVANDLTVKFDLDHFDSPGQWAGHLISLLHRMAELGHLERLSVSVQHWKSPTERLSCHK